jgi:hypothetical protein
MLGRGPYGTIRLCQCNHPLRNHQRDIAGGGGGRGGWRGYGNKIFLSVGTVCFLDLKGLSHEMDLAFDDMHDQFQA